MTATYATLALLFAAHPSDDWEPRFNSHSAPYQVGRADAVVTGRVIEMEKGTVILPGFDRGKDQPALKHKIAILEVDLGISGAKTDAKLRVAFQADPYTSGEGIEDPDMPKPRQFRGGYKGLVYLRRAAGHDDLYVVPLWADMVPASERYYDREVIRARAAADMLDAPVKALKAERAVDRLAAANAVVGRAYRASPKEEGTDLPAEQTKLVVKAILDADWERPGKSTSILGSGPWLARQIGMAPGKNGVADLAIEPYQTRNKRLKVVLDAWAEKSLDAFTIKQSRQP